MSEQNDPDDDAGPRSGEAGRRPAGSYAGWSAIDAELLKRSAALPGFRQIPGAERFPAQPVDVVARTDAGPPAAAPISNLRMQEAAAQELRPGSLTPEASARPAAETSAAEEQWWPRAGAMRPVDAPADNPADNPCDDSGCERDSRDAAAVQARLAQRLAAIERNLSRIADALERRGLDSAEQPRGARLRDLGIAPRVPVSPPPPAPAERPTEAPATKPVQDISQEPVQELANVPGENADDDDGRPVSAAAAGPQLARDAPAPVLAEPTSPVRAAAARASRPEPGRAISEAATDPEEAPYPHARDRWITAAAVAAVVAGIVYLSPGHDLPTKLRWLGAMLWRAMVLTGTFLANLGDAIRAAFNA